MAASSAAAIVSGDTLSREFSNDITNVQLDGLVVCKIIKHSRECLPDLVTGQLVGMDWEDTLQVTNCFAVPTEDEDDDVDYQTEMMKRLKMVNVDNNTVGWYQSTFLGSFLGEEMIQTQFKNQSQHKNCVVIVYDPVQSSTGTLCLKAFRLTQSFMNLFKGQNFSQESLTKADISSRDIVEELPITVTNSHLVHALLHQLREEGIVNSQVDFDRLDASFNPYMERNLEFLLDCVDELAQEQNKFQYYQRNLQRQATQQQAYLQKRKMENDLRRQAGQRPLPEEDRSQNPLFRPLPAPPRLDTLLATHQINNHCQQINSFAAQSTRKLFLVNNLHKQQPDSSSAVAAAASAAATNTSTQ